ncbi:DUF3291 domain-containing protein [Roseibium sp. Sym1]|uniref:DUF3291 domain-containing protein n=1 Tax=Roseibium sp. Sym1 TaxID=3016006 RepID=UPI0022B37D19|nr:DUF3291 domain-containing protein [Roseibium sp. Sym1]
MTGYRLALYTFGQFRTRADHPDVDIFHAEEPRVWAAMERAEGFIARSGYDDEPGPDSWGEQVYPRYWQDNGDGWAPSIISIWQDLETAMAAVYRGPHAEILREGPKFMQEDTDYPAYVLWWVPDTHQPDWEEAVERFELLGDTGPSPEAFSFKAAFDPAGKPVTANSDLARQIAERNRLRAEAPKAVQ